ncbi:hypothetical protein DCCM_3537 [Desulfocucumis palustris]|uniref:Uncharacterized protein n=1 Tax=Desulfocucumis palustris TaxID=1898651 RepID=A0A2L2XKI1_9FIRM|nr:hypothetical protein [Desulfocucumis palustris]GBF34421.1 hypothetical protein DCCM_3537 [Desulfocucumis palustris]
MNKSQKVIQFEPRKKKKLKDVNYVSPEKKELLRQREKQKKLSKNSHRTIVLVGIFLLIVAVVVILDYLI